MKFSDEVEKLPGNVFAKHFAKEVFRRLPWPFVAIPGWVRPDEGRLAGWLGLVSSWLGFQKTGLGLPEAGLGLPEADLGLPKTGSGLREASSGLPGAG